MKNYPVRKVDYLINGLEQVEEIIGDFYTKILPDETTVSQIKRVDGKDDNGSKLSYWEVKHDFGTTFIFGPTPESIFGPNGYPNRKSFSITRPRDKVTVYLTPNGSLDYQVTEENESEEIAESLHDKVGNVYQETVYIPGNLMPF